MSRLFQSKSTGTVESKEEAPKSSIKDKLSEKDSKKAKNDITQNNEINRWMDLGPVILFSTAFERSVCHVAPESRITMKVPTCYSPLQDDASAVVKVERTIWSQQIWEEYQRFYLPRDGWIKFVIHESRNLNRSYRLSIKPEGCRKSVAHMMFASERSKNNYELIWCFCDNLKEAKLELQKNMKAREYFMIKQAEELFMSETDSFLVYLIIPGGSVTSEDPPWHNPVQKIEADQLWRSDSFEELSFIVENLKEGGDVEYKIQIMKTEGAISQISFCGGKIFKFHNNAEEMESYFI